MKKETVRKGATMRGNVEYIEIERINKRFENIMVKLKSNSFSDISKPNQKVLYEFLDDMSKGKYTPVRARKGRRSFKRLSKLFYSLKTFSSFYSGSDILNISEKELHNVFDAINTDKICRKDGKPYSNKRDFKKDFSTLWHWHMLKTYKTTEKRIDDITEYISTPLESRSKFCYFTFKQLQSEILMHTTNEDLRLALLVLFDSGLRPSEFYNIRRSDIKERDGKLQLSIKEEVSKTFERTITLALVSQFLKKYLDNSKFKRDDLVFLEHKYKIDQFLIMIRQKKNVKKIIEDSGASKISAYDFRHSSACHYINVYKEGVSSKMKYRYGWKKESMIEYYTNFLGVSDIITDEDLLDAQDKNKYLEENKHLKDEMQSMKEGMKLLAEQMKSLMAGKEIDLTEKEKELRVFYDNV